MTAQAAAVPPRPDLDPAPIARLRDALLGGTRATARERKLAARLAARWPALPGLIWGTVAFHARAACWAVEEGAATVVFGAAGYPVPDAGLADARAAGYPVPGQLPLHARAATAAPRARMVYADADEVATAVNGVLLADPDPARVTAVQASVRDPEKLLDAARVPPGGPPACVQLQCVLHWLPCEFAAWLVAEYARLLPSGSSIAMTMVIPGANGGDGLAAAARGSGGRLRPYSPADLEGWVEGAGMGLTRWGVTDVRAGEMRWPEEEFARHPGPRAVEAVAVKP